MYQRSGKEECMFTLLAPTYCAFKIYTIVLIYKVDWVEIRVPRKMADITSLPNFKTKRSVYNIKVSVP
jgi:hypothetical protein